MLAAETKRKARELGVHGLVEGMEAVTEDRSYAGLSVEEALAVVVDHAWQETANRKVASLVSTARLRLPQADLSNIDYEGRPLERSLLLSLGTAQFVASATDVSLQGFTGTGKSHLACALGKQACKHQIKTLYVRMPDMYAYRAERLGAGWPEKKILNHYQRYKLLIVDDFMIDQATSDQAHFLLELVERRYDTASTIWCSQYGPQQWVARLGGGATAEAIVDRIVNNCVTIEMGEVNMRERVSGRNAPTGA